MKKIMFNDKYGLTEAVLQGRKTMTRRIESGMENLQEGNFCFLKGKKEIELYGEKGTIIETIKPRYKVGEVVAIAQSYKILGWKGDEIWRDSKSLDGKGVIHHSQGWTNKMFVRAEACTHRIRITDLKVERLQDISDEDCMLEGILQREIMPFSTIDIKYQVPKTTIYKDTPREAFAALIDKVSGRGTWDRNPWVFAYSFELVK